MNQTPISESAPMGCIGKGSLSLLGIALIAGGLAGLWFVLLKPVLRVQGSQSWPQAKCVITDSRVQRHEDDDGDSYSAEISFKYEVDKKEYTSATYSFYEWSGSMHAAQAVCNKYPKGVRENCFYNPNSPNDAVLDRSFAWLSLFALLFLFLPLIGLAIVWGIVQPSKRKLRDRSKFDSGPVDGQFYQRDDQLAEIFTPEYEGPQKLKPESGRWGGLIFAVLFSLVLFVVEFFVWRSGGISVISVILGLVCLGCLALLVYQLLAITNPIIEIAISNGTVVPGETIDIAWETIGNHSRIKTLSLFVDAEETAEYTRGTDRVTDREQAFLATVASITEKQDMQFGSATFTVPLDAIHSFASNNNTVTWRIRVLCDIPMWPDVSGDYNFMVRPNE